MPNGNQFSTGLDFGLPQLGLAEEETDPIVDPTVQLTTRPSQTAITPEQIGLAQRNLEQEQARNAEARAARNQRISGILTAIGAGLAAFGGNQQLATSILSQQAGARQARAEREFAERQAEREKQNQRELLKLRADIEKDLSKVQQAGRIELQEREQEFVAGESEQDRELRRQEGELNRDLEERRLDATINNMNAQLGIEARREARLSESERRDRLDKHFGLLVDSGVSADRALVLSQITARQLPLSDLDPATRRSVELELSAVTAKSPGQAQQVFLARMNEDLAIMSAGPTEVTATQRNEARTRIASAIELGRARAAQGDPNFQQAEPLFQLFEAQANLVSETRRLDPAVEDTADETRSVLTLGGTQPAPRTDAEYATLPSQQQKQYERGLQVEAEKAAEAGVQPDDLAPLMLRLGIPTDSDVLKDIYTRAYHRRVKEIEQDREINTLRTKQRRGERLTDEEIETLRRATGTVFTSAAAAAAQNQ